MAKGKKLRQRGKIKLSQYFKKIVAGKTVAIVPELGIRISFPKRIYGKSGKVVGDRGRFKVVKLRDGNKEKTFIIHPVHLKMLDQAKASTKQRPVKQVKEKK